MNKRTKVRDFIKRHFQGIIEGLALVVISSLLFYRLGSMLGGLTAEEIASAERSSRVSPLKDIVNLPWLLWQGLFIRTLGLSTWSVRLPAAILGVISLVVLWRVLRRMTDRNSAMLGTVIATTSALYLGLGRAGVSSMMTILLMELIILFGIKAFRGERGLAMATVCWGLLFFMDCGFVVALALLAVAILHPQTRLWLTNDKKRLVKVSILGGIFVLSYLGLSAMGLSVGRDWPLGSLGRPSVDNLQSAFDSAFGVNSHLSGGLVTPFVSIIGLTLAALGLVSIIRDSAFCLRAYLVMGLFALVLGLCVFDPGASFLIFLPVALLITIAVSELVGGWYNIFPSNPYARGFAVAPLVLLVCSLCMLNVGRYFMAINYNANVAYRYDYSVSAVRKITGDSRDNYTLVDDDDDARLYNLVKADNLMISQSVPRRGKIIILGNDEAPSGFKLERVVTNGLSRDNVVARVYYR